MRLGVNIDHVATLRQARYQKNGGSPNREPSLLKALQAAERGGADGITLHLRQDRRHVQERDLWEVREALSTKMNVELGNTQEIIEIVLEVAPDAICLVPESREEITTEGGLNCLGSTNQAALQRTIARFQEKKIEVALFIDPDPEQVQAAVLLGANAIELHTGAYAEALGQAQLNALRRLQAAAALGASQGLAIHAGHGLNEENVIAMHQLTACCELNIGHSLISRSLFLGLEEATRRMKQLLRESNQ